jgi:hypothetical protein
MKTTKYIILILRQKLCICFILLSFCCIEATGQLDSLKYTSKLKNYGFIQFNVGMGIPLGDYFFFNNPYSTAPFPNNPSIQAYNRDGGQALVGYTINLSIAYPVMKSHWGIMLMSSYSVNSFDYSSIFSYPSPIVTGDFNGRSVVGGIFYSVPVKYSLFDFRILAGPLYFKYPGVTYSEYYNNMALAPGYGVSYKDTWTLSQGNTLSFAYDVGVGWRRLMTKKLFLSVNIDIFKSLKAGTIIQTGKYTDNYTGQTASIINTCSANVSQLNIIIGIGYHIGW